MNKPAATKPNKRVKLFIGIPSQGHWVAEFGMHLLNMSQCLHRPYPGITLQYQFNNVRGSILPQLRTQMVQQAKDIGATHILMLDSDMIFPAELAQEWAAEDREVIAANCMIKAWPSAPTARMYNGTPEGRKLYCDPDQRWEKVWRVGTGIMMIDMRVFDKIEQPWFPITWRPESETYQGEDWGFAELCEKAGIAMWVDQEASSLVGHIGNYTFTHHHVAIEEPEVVIPGTDENHHVQLEIVKR